MAYDQRPPAPRTDTTRHLDSSEFGEHNRDDDGYYEGARKRTARFAKSTAHLREVRAEIEALGREAQSRPTGVLSGGDVDIAYHYLGLGIGIIAALYSILGTIFALHGGSAAMISQISQQWSAGPATALTDALLNLRTGGAIILQAVLFIVIIGTRRSQHAWQHWTALMVSAALTYAGWSTLLTSFGTEPIAFITTTIPAALIGGALGWIIVRATSETALPRWLMPAVVCAGVLAGVFGTVALIHWVALLLAWSADQVARRIMVIG